MCSLEFISLKPAIWTSKLHAIAMIIWMMFYYSLEADGEPKKKAHKYHVVTRGDMMFSFFPHNRICI